MTGAESRIMVSGVGLHISFAGVKAVDGIDLMVKAGERRVIIGPNGAGKSTLFNLLAGSLLPEAGRVEIGGVDVTNLPAPERARLGLARTFQITNLFGHIPVMDNVRLAVAAHGRARRVFWAPLAGRRDVDVKAEELLREWGMWDIRSKMPDELAYGQQRLLEIVMGLAGDPKVLLLDEPTAGLGHADASMMTDIARELPRSLTLLIIEHDMDVAFTLADRITVLDGGRELTTGDPAAVRADPSVQAAYLGQATP